MAWPILLALAGTAAATTFPLPPDGSDLVGTPLSVSARYEDTLVDLGNAHDIGYLAMRNANPDVDPWLPGTGTTVVIPAQRILPAAPREGVVINLPEMRLYYYPPGGREVVSHPVSIGRMDWSTPLGVMRVIQKTENPAWHPPDSVRTAYLERGVELPDVVPPGPRNPLGTHALRLSNPSYLIHGTSWPHGIGMRVTHGCIRLSQEAVVGVFEQIPVGTTVRVVNQPLKAGWSGDRLYVEAHPPLEELHDPQYQTPMVRVLVAAMGEEKVSVDWERVRQVMREARGVPVAVATRGPVLHMAADPQAVDDGKNVPPQENGIKKAPVPGGNGG
ncbi:MAG: L,D-transpeptidase family protein [Ectothiorhodospiraceae bacterium]|nr:L,D-transpeptidase family protein [Ectothiorhodospiraceae bacterium]